MIYPRKPLHSHQEKYTEVTIDTTLNFENGNSFSGNWKYGNINGFGHYAWDGIGVYKGNWLDGKKHGKEQWYGMMDQDIKEIGFR